MSMQGGYLPPSRERGTPTPIFRDPFASDAVPHSPRTPWARGFNAADFADALDRLEAGLDRLERLLDYNQAA